MGVVIKNTLFFIFVPPVIQKFKGTFQTKAALLIKNGPRKVLFFSGKFQFIKMRFTNLLIAKTEKEAESYG